MSESRKNRLSMGGGQVTDDEQVASYKPIPEKDAEFRTSKNSLAKSKEKISPDGAEEKLLPKEVEAKIVTRVNMADAKYVVEENRNGDAKIELDANKKPFTGLTKEELMKYADDPLWVNVRWFMFVLFWASWLCMLAGAITIIVMAPKCAAPTRRSWSEKGPLVEVDDVTYDEIVPMLPQLQTSKIQGIFIDVPTYEYGTPSVIDKFKSFVEKAKEYGIKVIVDLIPNYVSIDNDWFQKSVKKEAPYTDYFVWAAGKDYVNNTQNPPNNWISVENIPAWTKNEVRGEFYLHQYGVNQPDLNFNNEAVIKEFESALNAWMKAGAAGVRLNKVRQLLVNMSLPDELAAAGRDITPGSDHTQYGFYRHQQTSDRPQLDKLLPKWSDLVSATSDTPCDTVFTMAEEGGRKELFRSRNLTSLRPPMTSPITVDNNASLVANAIKSRLGKWPAMQLKTSTAAEEEEEIAALALLLPASPVFDLQQVIAFGNDTASTDSLSHLVSLRSDASVEHGQSIVTSVPAGNNTQETLLVCARWKNGHTGYLAVFNPLSEEQRANLTMLESVPEKLTVHHMSHAVRTYTNYTNNIAESASNVLVPPRGTVVLSYVPKTVVEN